MFLCRTACMANLRVSDHVTVAKLEVVRNTVRKWKQVN